MIILVSMQPNLEPPYSKGTCKDDGITTGRSISKIIDGFQPFLQNFEPGWVLNIKLLREIPDPRDFQNPWDLSPVGNLNHHEGWEFLAISAKIEMYADRLL